MTNTGKEVSVEDGALVVRGDRVPTRLPVIDAARVRGRLIVVYDPDADPRQGRVGTFRNLASIDAEGTELWLADTPTTTTGDAYYRIASTEPLRVHSMEYLCTIDAATGQITDRQFTK